MPTTARKRVQKLSVLSSSPGFCILPPEKGFFFSFLVSCALSFTGTLKGLKDVWGIVPCVSDVDVGGGGIPHHTRASTALLGKYCTLGTERCH